MQQPFYVIGAGGHALAVLAALEANQICASGIYDDDASKWGSSLLNIPIKGGLADFSRLGRTSAIIAIGDNAKRKEIAERFTEIDWLTVIHPYTYIHQSVNIGRGSIILEATVLQPNVTIGCHCIVNIDSKIAHDCVLEDYVHCSYGKLAGNVYVCEGALLGTNTSVHPGVRIGAWSKSAVGSAIMRDVPPHSTVIGNPARILKR